jgi:hypothetical protein
VPEIIPGIMPGAEHMIEFHGVIERSCWAAIVGEPPIRLDERDVVLFPQSKGGRSSSGRSSGAVPGGAQTGRVGLFGDDCEFTVTLTSPGRPPERRALTLHLKYAGEGVILE